MRRSARRPGLSAVADFRPMPFGGCSCRNRTSSGFGRNIFASARPASCGRPPASSGWKILANARCCTCAAGQARRFPSGQGSRRRAGGMRSSSCGGGRTTFTGLIAIRDGAFDLKRPWGRKRREDGVMPDQDDNRRWRALRGLVPSALVRLDWHCQARQGRGGASGPASRRPCGNVTRHGAGRRVRSANGPEARRTRGRLLGRRSTAAAAACLRAAVEPAAGGGDDLREALADCGNAVLDGVGEAPDDGAVARVADDAGAEV